MKYVHVVYLCVYACICVYSYVCKCAGNYVIEDKNAGKEKQGERRNGACENSSDPTLADIAGFPSWPELLTM